MSALHVLALALAACTMTGPLSAQDGTGPEAATAATADDTSVTAFVADVRAASVRYRDRGQAILDGYRPIGTDFPGMGEHWIQIATLFAGRFAVRNPPVLEYATIGGRPTLVGVAYALPLLAGEAPPAFPGPHAWHEHTGTVAEETDLFSQVMASHESMRGARLAMLHVWVWLPNRAGVFASDNWSLPFVRAGLAAPAAEPGPDAGRVVSLVSGGDAFYENVFRSVAGAVDGGSDSLAIHDAVAAARLAATDWVASHREGTPSVPTLDQLRSIWSDMWRRLDSRLSDDARHKLHALEAM